MNPAKSVGDSDAMLFNLSKQRHFPNKGTGNEIRCSSGSGPNFCAVVFTELGAREEPFNGNKKCYSFANKPGYCIPEDKDGKNMLTNKENGSFTVSDLEVWQVTEMVSNYSTNFYRKNETNQRQRKRKKSIRDNIRETDILSETSHDNLFAILFLNTSTFSLV
jgi:hypothetical protein